MTREIDAGSRGCSVRSDRDCASIDDGRVVSRKCVREQECPSYLDEVVFAAPDEGRPRVEGRGAAGRRSRAKDFALMVAVFSMSLAGWWFVVAGIARVARSRAEEIGINDFVSVSLVGALAGVMTLFSGIYAVDFVRSLSRRRG